MLIRTTSAAYALTVVLAMAAPAAAQSVSPAGAAVSATGDVAEVVVTGSRISRRDYVSNTPIVTVDESLVAPSSTGAVTLEVGLNSLPQLSASASSGSSFTANAGQANLDLRGMGTQRTLVLIDGRRFVPSLPNGTVDVNNIPSALVANVEVITGGASAIYGSDAIAGVVNIKLKPRFTGLEVNAQIGSTSRGDGATQNFSVIAGSDFAEERGNAYVALDYSNRDRVNSSERSYLRGQTLTENLPSGNIRLVAGNLPTQAAVNGVFAAYGIAPGTVRVASSLLFSTNQDRTLFTQQGAINYKGPTTAPFYLVTTPSIRAPASIVGITTSAQDFLSAQIPLERYSFVAHTDYKVSDGISVYLDGLYTRYTTETRKNPSNIGSTCCTLVTVPTTNPFIPADLRTILASRPNPTASFTMFFPGIAFQPPRDEVDKYNVYQFTVGAKGAIDFQDISWNAYATRGETQYDATELGYQSLTAVNNLLAAPGGGTGLCTGGFNPFGINPPSAACYTYLNRTAHNSQTLVQEILEVDTQGRLFDLPAGEARFAAGASHRNNSYSFTPDPLISSGELSNTPIARASSGSVKVSEVYVEVLAPLLKDMAFVEEFNLDLGYRYSDYEFSGGISTYKADFNWKVAGGLMLRGGYARATRAPNVGDLFQASTVTQVSIGAPGNLGSGDPCDSAGAYVNPAKNPNAAKVTALCASQGVPVGFINPQDRPSAATQGNLDLKPESADTFSFGGVLRSPFDDPRFSKMSLSIDYYDIKVSDTMGTIGAQAILNNCYSAGFNPSFAADNVYCARVARDRTTGLISIIGNPQLNLGKYRTSGVDVQFDWSLPLESVGLSESLGVVSINLLANYLDSFKIQSIPGGATLEYAGTIGNLQIDPFAPAHPRWKGAATLGWEIGPVEASLRWRYLGDMDNAAFVGTTNTGSGAPAVSYFDFNAAWTIRENLKVSVGVINLFDQDPPFLDYLRGNTDVTTYDLVGRRGFIALKAKF